MSDPSTERAFLVQRRLPGVQGENGCYSDVGTFNADSYDDALRQACNKLGNSHHMINGGLFRVTPAPEWVSFRPQVKTTRTVEIEVGNA